VNIKRFITILLAFVMLVSPVILNASQDASSAIIAADKDVKTNTNGLLWLGAGCMFGLLGVGAAYIMEPSPKASSLLGKSPEYVAAYTDEYKLRGRTIQTRYAWAGTFIRITIYGVYFLLIATARENIYSISID